jgi:hypothetical protein
VVGGKVACVEVSWWGSKKTIFRERTLCGGVRRISLATSLYRAAITGLLKRCIRGEGQGQFAFVHECVRTAELNKLMRI